MTERRGLALSVTVVALVIALVIALGLHRPSARLTGQEAPAASPSASPRTASAIPSPKPSSTAKKSTTASAVGSAYQAVAPKGTPAFTASFGGSQLSSSLWDTCYPGSDMAAGCTNFGNNEYEWYQPSQVQVSGSMLRLIASRQPTTGTDKNGNAKQYSCRSGMATTAPGFSFEYGFFQVDARVPHASGLWPALWLAPANGQWPPEMDLIESWGVADHTASYFHPNPSSVPYSRGNIPAGLWSGWHTYSLYWTSSRMEFFVDKTLILTITSHIPHLAMYFIANVAEYLSPTAGTCSGELDIRSVKYWRA